MKVKSFKLKKFYIIVSLVRRKKGRKKEKHPLSSKEKKTLSFSDSYDVLSVCCSELKKGLIS